MSGLDPALRRLPPAPPATAGGVRACGPRHDAAAPQEVWIAFSGRADHPWLRLLAPGFRHCFAALRDAEGWTVLDPLTGRLVAARLPVPPGHDVPRFWRRAGLRVLGPFRPSPPGAGSWLMLSPFSCVALCRAVLGPDAPFAWTPKGLHDALTNLTESRKKSLTLPATSR